jgi:ATP-binding protein involved in chromosome partitioning
MNVVKVTETDILDALRRVPLGKGANVVDSGIVSGLSIRGGVVAFALEIGADEARSKGPLRSACADAVSALPGVSKVNAVLTATVKPAAEAQRPRPAQHIPGVAAVVAVASGKGGVGKSTVSVNLALGLAAEGLRVGILDADIYGPSLPRLLGIEDQTPEVVDNNRMRPLTAFGLATMSMGFLVPPDTATVWRGPMVTNALRQFLRTVEWGELDVLVIDFPPGTGDAHLTLAQTVPITGAVIVSTPQDIALIDARKGIQMFEKVDVPVLGIVENMSYFVCTHCGERSEIFGHGGARAEADKRAVPFLGEVPLDARIRETSDAGTPIVTAEPDSPQASLFRALARATAERLALVQGMTPPPSAEAE